MRTQHLHTTAPLSDQLRQLILGGEMSRYQLAKNSGVDAGQLCRFVHGSGRLTTDTLDRIGKVLGLSFGQFKKGCD